MGSCFLIFLMLTSGLPTLGQYQLDYPKCPSGDIISLAEDSESTAAAWTGIATFVSRLVASLEQPSFTEIRVATYMYSKHSGLREKTGFWNSHPSSKNEYFKHRVDGREGSALGHALKEIQTKGFPEFKRAARFLLVFAGGVPEDSDEFEEAIEELNCKYSDVFRIAIYVSRVEPRQMQHVAYVCRKLGKDGHYLFRPTIGNYMPGPDDKFPNLWSDEVGKEIATRINSLCWTRNNAPSSLPWVETSMCRDFKPSGHTAERSRFCTLENTVVPTHVNDLCDEWTRLGSSTASFRRGKQMSIHVRSRDGLSPPSKGSNCTGPAAEGEGYNHRQCPDSREPRSLESKCRVPFSSTEVDEGETEVLKTIDGLVFEDYNQQKTAKCGPGSIWEPPYDIIHPPSLDVYFISAPGGVSVMTRHIGMAFGGKVKAIADVYWDSEMCYKNCLERKNCFFALWNMVTDECSHLNKEQYPMALVNKSCCILYEKKNVYIPDARCSQYERLNIHFIYSKRLNGSHLAFANSIETPMECLIECLKHERCLSADYDQLLQQCSLKTHHWVSQEASQAFANASNYNHIHVEFQCAEDDSCPPHWHYATNGACYFYSYGGSLVLDYSGAKVYCEQRKGYLAYVRSNDKPALLELMQKNTDVPKKQVKALLFGLKYYDTLFWGYSDKKPIDDAWTLKYHKYSCAVAHCKDDCSWEDHDCDVPANFLCELPHSSPARITTQRIDTIIYIGEKYLVCNVSGYPPPRVSWWTRSIGERAERLRLARIVTNVNRISWNGKRVHCSKRKHDAADYQCQTANAYGGEVSIWYRVRNAEFEVVAQKDIPMKIMSGEVGKELIVPCPLTPFKCKPLPSFRWDHRSENSTPIGLFGEIVPFTESTLRSKRAGTIVIPELKEWVYGYYLACDVYSMGTAKKLGMVRVKKQQLGDVGPLEVYYPRGEEKTVIVSLGEKDFLTAVFKGGQNRNKRVYEWTCPPNVPCLKPNLNHMEVNFESRQQEGNYSVCATDGREKKCAEFHLKILYPPEFIPKYIDVNVTWDGAVTISCPTENSTSKISQESFYINGDPHYDTDGIKLVKQSQGIALSITKIRRQFRVSCFALNDRGQQSIMSGLVLPLVPIRWVTDGPGTYHFINTRGSSSAHKVVFRCDAVCARTDHILVTWYHDIPHDQLHQKPLPQKYMMPTTMYSGPGRSVLSLNIALVPEGKTAREEYQGRYTCYVDAEHNKGLFPLLRHHNLGIDQVENGMVRYSNQNITTHLSQKTANTESCEYMCAITVCEAAVFYLSTKQCYIVKPGKEFTRKKGDGTCCDVYEKMTKPLPEYSRLGGHVISTSSSTETSTTDNGFGCVKKCEKLKCEAAEWNPDTRVCSVVERGGIYEVKRGDSECCDIYVRLKDMVRIPNTVVKGSSSKVTVTPTEVDCLNLCDLKSCRLAQWDNKTRNCRRFIGGKKTKLIKDSCCDSYIRIKGIDKFENKRLEPATQLVVHPSVRDAWSCAYRCQITICVAAEWKMDTDECKTLEPGNNHVLVEDENCTVFVKAYSRFSEYTSTVNEVVLSRHTQESVSLSSFDCLEKCHGELCEAASWNPVTKTCSIVPNGKELVVVDDGCCELFQRIDEACTDGTFGRGCKGVCHCAKKHEFNKGCNPHTGKCFAKGCEPGFYGQESCQYQQLLKYYTPYVTTGDWTPAPPGDLTFLVDDLDSTILTVTGFNRQHSSGSLLMDLGELNTVYAVDCVFTDVPSGLNVYVEVSKESFRSSSFESCYGGPHNRDGHYRCNHPAVARTVKLTIKHGGSVIKISAFAIFGHLFQKREEHSFGTLGVYNCHCKDKDECAKEEPTPLCKSGCISDVFRPPACQTGFPRLKLRPRLVSRNESHAVVEFYMWHWDTDTGDGPPDVYVINHRKRGESAWKPSPRITLKTRKGSYAIHPISSREKYEVMVEAITIIKTTGGQRETNTRSPVLKLYEEDGSWSEWFNWGQCSSTVTHGLETRRRLCDRPKPSTLGLYCRGSMDEYRKCGAHVQQPKPTKKTKVVIQKRWATGVELRIEYIEIVDDNEPAYYRINVRKIGVDDIGTHYSTYKHNNDKYRIETINTERNHTYGVKVNAFFYTNKPRIKFGGPIHDDEVTFTTDMACPKGKYGRQCEHNCHCKPETTCNDWTGECSGGCSVRYSGSHCTIDNGCSKGSWGEHCSQNCLCESCDPDTGKCPPVNTCPPMTFGDQCQYTCNCLKENEQCNHVTGNCTTGCEQRQPGLCAGDCIKGRYGSDCEKKCACPSACDRITGQCKACPDGFFGYGCQYTCGDCKGKCDPDSGYCEPQCNAGSYGHSCNNKCFCDGSSCTRNGYCVDCSKGYGGAYCNTPCKCGPGKSCQKDLSCVGECPPGKSGEACKLNCNCTGGCEKSGKCKHSGVCKPGYYGSSCKNECGFKEIDGCKIPTSTSTECKYNRWGTGCTKYCKCKDVREACALNGPGCLSGCRNGWCGPQCDINCQCIYGTPSFVKPCTCEPFYFGFYCSTPCQCQMPCSGLLGNCPKKLCNLNYFGPDCQKKCNCEVPCDPVTGKCPGNCISGKTGLDCQVDCLCKNSEPCDKVTAKCGKCPPGRWGHACQHECGCNDCTPGTNVCQKGNCPPGRVGLQCEKVCHCKGTCHPLTAYCNGDCEDGWFDLDCQRRCHCDRCTKVGACIDHVCYKGFFGLSCDQKSHCAQSNPRNGVCTPDVNCDLGWWGLRCDRKCQDCPSGVGCHRYLGICHTKCKAGDCTTDFACRPDRYGPKCSPCHCKNPGVCSPLTGECSDGNSCAAGWWGPDCQSKCHCQGGQGCGQTYGNCPGGVLCERGYFGPSCGFRCTCKGGICNETFGNCTSGYDCPKGRYGLNCSDECHCDDCDSFTGKCKTGCHQGFFGPRCEHSCHCKGNCATDSKCQGECKEGRFGYNCSGSCHCDSAGDCDKSTGVCSKGCAAGWWGHNCQNLCSCINGVCDPEDGRCNIGDCPPNKFGLQCEKSCHCDSKEACPNHGFCKKCDIDHYGPDCQVECHCKQPCHRFSGECRGSCKDGYYGFNCRGVCHCAPGGICNKTHVVCKSGCELGYYGVFCDLKCGCPVCDRKTGLCDVCRSGFFGKKCDKRCQCEKGEMCPHDGVCVKCRKGFFGKHCDKDCGRCLNGCERYSGICSGSPKCANRVFGLKCESMSHCIGGTAPPPDGPCAACKATYYGIRCSERCLYCAPGTACWQYFGQCYSCPIGKTGPFCDTKCPCAEGVGCNQQTRRCSHCLNNDKLIPTSGCPKGCQPGWSGKDCTVPTRCSGLVFGDRCQYKCNCSHPLEKCDEETGRCSDTECVVRKKDGLCLADCVRGRWGEDCENHCDCAAYEFCNRTFGCLDEKTDCGLVPKEPCHEKNRYGSTCSRPCFCKDDEPCHRCTGECVRGCKEGKSGPDCSKPRRCSGFTYGDRCQFKCSYCSHPLEKCDEQTGRCSGRNCSVRVKDGLCTGDCVEGLWGEDCNKHCNCSEGQACERTSGCVDEKDCSLDRTGACKIWKSTDTLPARCSRLHKCDEETGSGPDYTCTCIFREKDGLCLGVMCSRIMGENCENNRDGAEFQVCDRTSGGLDKNCSIVPKEPCQEKNRYSSSCSRSCYCKDDEPCHRCTGVCERGCKDGIVGKDCSKRHVCKRENMYGPFCNNSCNCLKATDCNPLTGHCGGLCPMGWKGDMCTTIAPCPLKNTFGRYCTHKCHCNKPSCDRFNGSCEDYGGCSLGWSGKNCSEFQVGVGVVGKLEGKEESSNAAIYATVGVLVVVCCAALGIFLFVAEKQKKQRHREVDKAIADVNALALDNEEKEKLGETSLRNPSPEAVDAAAQEDDDETLWSATTSQSLLSEKQSESLLDSDSTSSESDEQVVPSEQDFEQEQNLN